MKKIDENFPEMHEQSGTIFFNISKNFPELVFTHLLYHSNFLTVLTDVILSYKKNEILTLYADLVFIQFVGEFL